MPVIGVPDEIRGEIVKAFIVPEQDVTVDKALEDQLVQKIESYSVAINIYAESALKQESIHGGKGPFRQISHDIEDLLKAHHVPDLGKDLFS